VTVPVIAVPICRSIEHCGVRHAAFDVRARRIALGDQIEATPGNFVASSARGVALAQSKVLTLVLRASSMAREPSHAHDCRTSAPITAKSQERRADHVREQQDEGAELVTGSDLERGLAQSRVLVAKRSMVRPSSNTMEPPRPLGSEFRTASLCERVSLSRKANLRRRSCSRRRSYLIREHLRWS
jgi:hypothetical protein